MKQRIIIFKDEIQEKKGWKILNMMRSSFGSRDNGKFIVSQKQCFVLKKQGVLFKIKKYLNSNYIDESIMPNMKERIIIFKDDINEKKGLEILNIISSSFRYRDNGKYVVSPKQCMILKRQGISFEIKKYLGTTYVDSFE